MGPLLPFNFSLHELCFDPKKTIKTQKELEEPCEKKGVLFKLPFNLFSHFIVKLVSLKNDKS